MSPEQLEGEADEPTDLWALGIVLYECIAAAHPFAAAHGDPADFQRAIREAPAPPLRYRGMAAPPNLAAVAPELLEKLPGRRITAHETVALLMGRTRPRPARSAPAPWPRERRPELTVQIDDHNADALLSAAQDGHAPDGVVAAISQPQALAAGRTISRTHGSALSVDVHMDRLTEPNWWRIEALKACAHAPSESVVLQRAQLRDAQAAGELARAALHVQADAGADRLRQPSVGCLSLAPPDAFADVALHDGGLAARPVFAGRDGRERPLDAVVRVPIDAVADTANHIRLHARFAGRAPDGTILHLDGLRPTTGIDRSLGVLRLALLLQEWGQPCRVVCGGPLRRVLTAFGVGGIELMPGRGECIPVRRAGAFAGGPGATVRFAFPSLLCTLPTATAAAVLKHGLVPERNCDCVGCAGRSLDERVANATVHGLCQELRTFDALDGIPPHERVRRLLADVERATSLHLSLRAAGVWSGDLKLLRRLRSVVEEAIEIGLLEPQIASTRPARVALAQAA
jgi:hypothetical protein